MSGSLFEPPPPGQDGPPRGGPPGDGPRPPGRRPGPEGGFGGPRGPRQDYLPRHIQHYVAGWANLRAGNLDPAVKHLQYVIRERRWAEADLAHALLAIAHHKAGRPDQARASLEKADAAIDLRLQEMEPSPGAEMHWIDLVEALLTHREATLLITGKPARIDPRMIAVQQEARQMLRGESLP